MYCRLLSNAGLPELNPLMDLGDDPAEDDFQKMLNEWENHIDTLKVLYIITKISYFHLQP